MRLDIMKTRPIALFLLVAVTFSFCTSPVSSDTYSTSSNTSPPATQAQIQEHRTPACDYSTCLSLLHEEEQKQPQRYIYVADCDVKFKPSYNFWGELKRMDAKVYLQLANTSYTLIAQEVVVQVQFLSGQDVALEEYKLVLSGPVDPQSVSTFEETLQAIPVNLYQDAQKVSCTLIHAAVEKSNLREALTTTTAGYQSGENPGTIITH